MELDHHKDVVFLGLEILHRKKCVCEKKKTEWFTFFWRKKQGEYAQFSYQGNKLLVLSQRLHGRFGDEDVQAALMGGKGKEKKKEERN